MHNGAAWQQAAVGAAPVIALLPSSCIVKGEALRKGAVAHVVCATYLGVDAALAPDLALLACCVAGVVEADQEACRASQPSAS